MKKLFLILIILIVITVGLFAEVKNNSETVFEGDMFTVSLEAGMKMLFGQTNEIVYNTEFSDPTYLSKLEWEQDATLVGGEVHMDFFERLMVNGSVYTNFGKRTGIMEDFDWLTYSPYDTMGNDPSEWTHYSLSDSEMEIQTYDLNFSLRTDKLFGFLELDGIFGLRNEQRYWTDKLQSLTYSSGYDADGFRDIEKEFDDVPGVNYDVSMTFPYAGVGIAFSVDEFYLRAYGLYGVADITATDNHLLRGITFVDTFEEAVYFEAGLDVSWNVTENYYFSLGGSYSIIPESVAGDTVLWDGEFKQLYSGVAGFSQESIMVNLSFGLTY